MTAEVPEEFKPKSVPWQCFEDEVAKHVREQIEDFNLGIVPQLAKVYQHRAYFSKDRGTEIIFDVAVEVFRTPDDATPHLIWLWECKDYPKNLVGVGEVEEFHHKLQQVRAHKGTIVTRVGFQSGAESLAESYRIGLVALDKERHHIFRFSRDGGVIENIRLTAVYAVDSHGNTFPHKRTALDEIIYRELIDLWPIKSP